jgi:ketosteroid isomerase-like protein
VAETVGERLVQAIANQDADAIAACFTPEAEFRALIPPGLRERQGAEEAAALFARWFGDSTELDLVESSAETIGDRLYVGYRFHGVEEGKPYVLEQHLYYTLDDGKIARADLLCSGFRPRAD